MRRSRTVRIHRKRMKQRQKKMAALLQSSLLISSLLIYSTKQIGTTYGEFNSTQDTEGSFQTCRIFPAQIEELLSTVSGHLDRVNENRQLIAPVSVTVQVYGNISARYEQEQVTTVTDAVYGGESTSPIYSVTDDVYGSGGGGSYDAESLAAQISVLASQLQAVQGQFNINQDALNLIDSEIAEGDRRLQELLGIMEELNSNCAEIRNVELLDELSGLSQQELLSQSMQEQIDAAIYYLRKVFESGRLLDLDPGLQSNQVITETFSRPAGSGEPLNTAAIHQYTQMQLSIEAIITDLSRSISQLESAMSLIPAKSNVPQPVKKPEVRKEEENTSLPMNPDLADNQEPLNEHTPAEPSIESTDNAETDPKEPEPVQTAPADVQSELITGSIDTEVNSDEN